MKRTFLFVALTALVLTTLTACSTEDLVNQLAKTHLLLASRAGESENGSGLCPTWTGFELWCNTDSQNLDGGTAQDPTYIPINAWETGQIQLRGDTIVSWSGIVFIDTTGVQVNPDQMEQGEWYYINKIAESGSFTLVSQYK